MGGAVVHHIQQQLLGEDVDLQALQRLVRGHRVDGQVGDPALLIHLHVLGEAGSALQGGCAHHGHIGPGVDVLLEHLGHRQVHRHVAPGQNHILLADVFQIVGHAGQGVHVAPVLAAPLRIAEGGQDAQAAVAAGQLPILTGAHVVQQGLIALMYNDAHVGNAGVDIVGEHEVHQAVPPAEGQGAGVPGTGQLPQVGVGPVRKNDAVQVVHACSPPFTSSRIMALGFTTALSPMATPPPTTAMPQSGSSLGGAPMVASSPMTAFSATMA